MIGAVITALFYAIIVCWLFFGLINLIRSNLYDIRQAKLRHWQLRHPHARQLRRRPWISVLVFADNNQAAIISCLESVIANNYRKSDILVVDNASGDSTSRLVRQFITHHPKQSIKLVAKRRPASRDHAIAEALRPGKIKGELVMVIDASCALDSQALKEAVKQMSDPALDAGLAHVTVDHDYRLLGLAGKFRALITLWSKKAGGYIGPTLDSYNYAASYRRSFLDQVKKPSSLTALSDINRLRRLSRHVVFNSYMRAETNKPLGPKLRVERPALKQPVAAVNAGRALLALIEPVIAAFMIYVAIEFHNPGYIILAWLSFTALLLLAIWSDDAPNLLDKFRLSGLALIAYTLYLLQLLLSYARAAGLVLSRTMSRAISSSMAVIR